MKSIVIIGAGGFGREVLWLIERINKKSVDDLGIKEWNILGFVDDNAELKGKIINDHPVIGTCDDLIKMSEKEDIFAVAAIGSAKVKKNVIQKIEGHVQFATVIDPSVIISDRVNIGEGCIVCAGSLITIDIKIGNHVIVNLDCTIGHDVVIEDYVTIYPSVNVSGNVVIGTESEVGTGTQIIQGKSIGRHSIMGAGAVVISNIPKSCTAVGVPAEPVKFF